MSHGRVWGLTLALALAAVPILPGCGAGGASEGERGDGRVIVRRGFRFHLPPGDGWVVRENTENQSYSLVARRGGASTFGETVTVHAGRHPFQFMDSVDFGDQMSRMVRRGFEADRYRVDELEVQLDERFGALCVRRWSVVQDAQAQGVASVIPLEVRTLGFTFVLPSDRGRLVHLEYAVRGTAAEVAASDWRARADAFLAGITLRGAR